MIDHSSSKVDLSSPAIDLDSCADNSQTICISEMNLKHQLKFFLERHEMSATQLSKKSGVSKQVISLWLSGGSPRNIEQVKKVAEVFNTSVDQLCFGQGMPLTQEKREAPSDEWLSGIFEVKIRRINKN